MVIVPGLAMFSHRLPAEWRTTLRQQVWIPAHDAIQGVAKMLSLTSAQEPAAESPFVAAATTEKPPASAPATTAAPAASGTPVASPPARVVMPTVPLAPANAIVDTPRPQGNGLAVPLATSRAADRSFTQSPAVRRQAVAHARQAPANAAPEPPPGQLAMPPTQEPAPVAAPPEPPLAALPAGVDTQQQLEALGAQGIECHPLDNGSAGYVASCRMNVDPKGELKRMFHGSGPDRSAALRALLEQVEFWTRNQAATPL